MKSEPLFHKQRKISCGNMRGELAMAYGLWLMDIDDTRFMNHSDTPNMNITVESEFTARAARDIAEGEELTEDYRQFDPDFHKYSSVWR